MGDMRFQDTKPYEDWFWEKNRIELIHDKVLLVNPSKNVLTLEKVGLMEYDELILATGSKSNRFGWKGQNIVRASCVGCGICSTVCPRGVLKLENGAVSGRV